MNEIKALDGDGIKFSAVAAVRKTAAKKMRLLFAGGPGLNELSLPMIETRRADILSEPAAPSLSLCNSRQGFARSLIFSETMTLSRAYNG